jgi:Tfp pilus assembly protein PilW
MKTLLRLLLKSQHQRNRSEPAQTDKGMTLVELLVGSIMAFLVITPMLAFVVDMLNTDRREQVKSNTEQDLQAAVDFIAQDLSQAIYIYDKAGIKAINSTTTKLPTAPANTRGTPILVFWKRQQIKNAVPVASKLTPKPINCKATAKPGEAGECNDTYVLSLVAYYQITDTTPNSTWCQPSGSPCPTRIARYEIREPVRNPYTLDATKPYYEEAVLSDNQKAVRRLIKTLTLVTHRKRDDGSQFSRSSSIG